MQKLALFLVIFLIHAEAIDDTQVGTFDSGVSSNKVKIGKRYKTPIENAETYDIDIKDGEVEGITSSPPAYKKELEKIEEPIGIDSQEINSTAQKATEPTREIEEQSNKKTDDFIMATQKTVVEPVETPESQKTVEQAGEKTDQSEVIQNKSGGVILPFDKVDEKSGVVLPMDKKDKGGFFSIFGF